MKRLLLMTILLSNTAFSNMELNSFIDQLSINSLRSNPKKLDFTYHIDIESFNGQCLHKRKNLTKNDLVTVFPELEKDYGPEAKVTNTNPHWSCIELKKHIKNDSSSCLIEPDDIIKNLYFKNIKNQTVKGKQKYIGVFPFPYVYHVKKQDEKIIIHLSIKYTDDVNENKLSNKEHTFKNALEKVKSEIPQVEKLYNESLPIQLQGIVYYKFSIKDSNADYKVKITSKNKNGPYNRFLSTRNIFAADSIETIAHEIGHMLGLNDEYDMVKNYALTGFTYLRLNSIDKNMNASKFFYSSEVISRNCNSNSLMCATKHGIKNDANKGESYYTGFSYKSSFLKDYHHYLILRRILCK